MKIIKEREYKTDVIYSRCFDYIDINNLSEDYINTIIRKLNEPINYDKLSEGREILLNKMQVWPYIYNVIHNIDKFQ